MNLRSALFNAEQTAPLVPGKFSDPRQNSVSQKSSNDFKTGIWPLNLLLLIHMFEQTVNPSDANHLTSFQIKLVQLHV